MGMKRNYYVFGLLLIAALTLYLNRAYAYFYYSIGHRAHTVPQYPIVTTVVPSSGQAIKNITYVALGDSLTAGVGAGSVLETYPYKIANHLANTNQANVTYVNLGIPGATAGQVVRDELEKAINYKPSVVTLLIGVNDMHNQVSKKLFSERVSKIVSSFPMAKVYVITAPYLGSSEITFPPYRWYFDWQMRGYNQVLQGLAYNYYFPVIDLYPVSKEAFDKDPANYSNDGFHPSALGYDVWSNFLYDHVNL
jgi:lysophospholipase L1-like esterase